MHMDLSWTVVVNFVTLYGVKVLASLLIFFIGKKIASLLTTVVVKGMRKSKIDETITSFFSNVIYFGLLVVIILAALSNLGINTTSFLAVLGTAGLAIGLALQGTLSNVGAGILLVFFRPFKIGHSVQIAGENGTVEELNLFSVILKTADNKQIIIPNSAVIGKNITNFSAKATRRIDMTFNIGYEDDLRLAKVTLQEIVDHEPRVLPEPSPFVAVGELAQNSVKLIVRVWVKTEDYSVVSFDIFEKVKLAFDEKRISIPHPLLPEA
ncbi:Small-conductance mechanosensitive channel [Sulfurospirillum diekertiae]|uniref:Small-conductance mechanosensitive channel n=2 Tax=Sulfurospirillum diekertiae TaxID=1854492 RepID=A0A1Y0HNC6_9BACT|nr:Small-conductance mechanosensitive channel [Sulfurospirillum diekertiae]ASC94403.1 Small-conductance mechanosensitive channel [Sulfurospirillum diekertiae]